jgi:hypothetical protein
MKKIVLDPQDLRVEAFHTSPAGESRGGTVRAHDGGSVFGPCESDRSCNSFCLPEPTGGVDA